MPRSPYFDVLASLVLLAAPMAAQNSAIVKHVVVRGEGDAMEVEIQTSGAPVSPDTQAIVGPDRIVVDFPGALPSSELRALKVNRGVLKGVRSGLFFNNPPITRIVLDLSEPQSYRISTSPNSIIVKLGPAGAQQQVAHAAPSAGAQLRDASLAAGPNVPAARISAASLSGPNVPRPANAAAASISHAGGGNSALPDANQQPIDSAPAPLEPPKPVVNVSYENGMLRIHAEKATLAQILFEVHQQTRADIAIPAGAEQEQVVADLGPAPARDVLGELLNGSPYNFVFVGDERALERVILTRRDPSIF
jgi:hypothetical protein